MIVMYVKMDMNIILIKKYVKVNLILNLVKFAMKVFLILTILIKVKIQHVDQEL